MNSESKLRQQEQQVQSEESLHAQTSTEFATAEELLRHDAAQIEVPGAVADRLNESIAKEPKPVRTWWRRFVSGD